MTQDEIVKLARKAGLVRTGDKWVEPARWGVTELVHFAALVAAAEREACAKVCDSSIHDTYIGGHTGAIHSARRECAAAIRARKENANE